MYNSNYEEYMQNVLGYSIRQQNTYQMPEDIYEIPRSSNYENMNLEGLYPDIYRMVYPMVQKVCMRATGIINEEMICSMTDEVYNAMSEDEKRSTNDVKKNSGEVRTNNSQNVKKVEETRQNNYLLRDLIRILIINELLRKRPGRPPMRPGYPGGPNIPKNGFALSYKL